MHGMQWLVQWHGIFEIKKIKSNDDMTKKKGNFLFYLKASSSTRDGWENRRKLKVLKEERGFLVIKN